jgi:hypothetical protein
MRPHPIKDRLTPGLFLCLLPALFENPIRKPKSNS